MPGSRSSKSNATISESRSTPSVSCVRSFEPIEKPSNNFGKRIDLDDVVGDLAHHVDLQPVLAALQAVRGHRRQHLLGLLDAAAERHHDHADWSAPCRRAPAAAPRIPARSRRHRPDARSARRRGTRASGWPRFGSNAAPPIKLRIFVGLEVRQPDDHRLGIERGGDRADALGQVARRRNSRGEAIVARRSSAMRCRALRRDTVSGCTSAIGCTPICSLMMNSMRARPTPSFGIIAVRKARSGLPRLTMMCGARQRAAC